MKTAMVTLLVITKIYLYNFDPLKPYFYIVKLGFTGVYNLCFKQKYEKYLIFLSENFQILGAEVFNIFE